MEEASLEPLPSTRVTAPHSPSSEEDLLQCTPWATFTQWKIVKAKQQEWCPREKQSQGLSG